MLKGSESQAPPRPEAASSSSTSNMVVTKPVLAAVAIAVLVLGFTVGILIGIFAINTPESHDSSTTETLVASNHRGDNDDDDCDKLVEDSFQLEQNITHLLIEEISGDNIRRHLQYISNISHIAGTKGNEHVRNYIYKVFDDLDLDEIKNFTYEVLLSYPNDDITKRNKVELVDRSTGEVTAYSKEREPMVHVRDDEFPAAYHAYAPAKSVEGDLVYANFASDEDFETLRSHHVHVNGTIIIARNGKIFRGNKVLNAQRNGAIGIILYSDPEEVVFEDMSDEKSEEADNNDDDDDKKSNGKDDEDDDDGDDDKNGKKDDDGDDSEDSDDHDDTDAADDEEISKSEALPSDGLQRGTIYEKIGDPLTPGYPAVAGAPRMDEDELKLPTIPSQPVDYSFAAEIMKHMGGAEIRDGSLNWKGRLDGVAYRTGPGFENKYYNSRVHMDIHNELEMKNITNIVGSIEGDIEPDRYVIIGNSYDAWGYGAVNPSSSTAQLLEIARAFSELKEESDWRPRRTILFAAWDAGKFGQIGSTEWVEEHLDLLTARTVAYINTESCIEEDDIQISASPILEQAALDMTGLIHDEDRKGKTLRDDLASDESEHEDIVSPLGAESDHAAFAFYAGIPSVDVHAKSEHEVADFYPRKNTRYDDMELVLSMDPDFKRSVSCAQYVAVLARYLADSTLLPYSVKSMSDTLVKAFKEHNGTRIKQALEKRNIFTFDELEEAIYKFDEEAEKFHDKVDEIDINNPLDVRMVNDQLMLLERAFIKPTGDEDDWFHRHLLYGPTDLDKNADSIFYMFHELTDLIDDVELEEVEEKREEETGHEEADFEDEVDVEEFWEKMEQYIHDVRMALKEAIEILEALPGVYKNHKH